MGLCRPSLLFALPVVLCRAPPLLAAVTLLYTPCASSMAKRCELWLRSRSWRG
jgi:hypothetical protein